MKTFEEWFYDQRGCTEEQFRNWCIANLSNGFRQRYLYIDDGRGSRKIALYDLPEKEAGHILKTYHERYREELDREELERMTLGFSDWLEGYHHMTPARLHELCEATGTTYREEARVMEWYRRRYSEYRNSKELGFNPFENNKGD